MNSLHTDLPFFVSLQLQQGHYNSKVKQLLKYLTLEGATPFGWFATLEENHIYNLKSIQHHLWLFFRDLQQTLGQSNPSYTIEYQQDLLFLKKIFGLEDEQEMYH